MIFQVFKMFFNCRLNDYLLHVIDMAAGNASMFLTEDLNAVVFDIGGFTAHFGFAGTGYPSLEFPTLIGKYGNDDRPVFGEETLLALQSGLDLKRIVIDGKIEDWDAYESMVEYAYSNCYYHPSKEHAVLISDSPLNTLRERERLCELMFEKFNVPAIFVVKTSFLALIANHKTSGLVVDIGHDKSVVCAVMDGITIQHSIATSPIAGRFLMEKLRENTPPVKLSKVALSNSISQSFIAPKFLEKKTEGLTSSHLRFLEDRLLTNMMSMLFRVNTDCTYRPDQLDQLPTHPFEYPNGFMREFREERFRYPEAFFDPRILDVQNPSYSLTRTIAASVSNCDTNLRHTVMGNVICTGGPSEIPSFADRLSNEITRKLPTSFRARVSQAPTSLERRYCSYMGGSILSSLGGFHEKWVSKVDYEERGRQAVQKCQY
ncbi:hypothetical protein ACOME3_009980 [Neoechinorhynchus agilis]